MNRNISGKRGGNVRNARTTHPNKTARREAALERQAACDKLTPQQRLDELDRLFGEGQGATKERLKLHNIIREYGNVSAGERRAKAEAKRKKRKDKEALAKAADSVGQLIVEQGSVA